MGKSNGKTVIPSISLYGESSHGVMETLRNPTCHDAWRQTVPLIAMEQQEFHQNLPFDPNF